MKGEPLDKRLVLGILWLLCKAIFVMLHAYPVPTLHDADEMEREGRAVDAIIARERHEWQQTAIQSAGKAMQLIETLASRHGYTPDEKTLTHL